MNCGTCKELIDTTSPICFGCGQKTHENCGTILAAPKCEDGESGYLFSCFGCRNQVQNFSPSNGSMETSSQVSNKGSVSESIPSRSGSRPRSEPDNKNLPKFDLKARKLILKEFFETEDKGEANSYSWIASCKLCNRDNSSSKSKQGKLKISKGSTRTTITHMIAFHNEEFMNFQENNQLSHKTKVTVVSKTSINSLKSLHREVMKWIVHSGQDFRSLEDPYLMNILTTLQSLLPGNNLEKSFPKSEAFRKGLVTFHEELEQEKIKATSLVDNKIALTVDVWTSKSQTSFLGITGHWIDSEFAFQSLLLGFVPIQGSPTTGVLLALFIQVIQKYKIAEKISSITLDNSALQNSFIKELTESRILQQTYYTSGDNLHSRCLAHVFHILAQTLVLSYDKVVIPPDASLQYFLSLRYSDTTLLPGEESSNYDLTERPLEMLRRVLAAIRDDVLHREVLEKFQVNEGHEPSTPIVDDRNHWTSTYAMLKWAIEHKQVIITLMGTQDALANHWQNFEDLLELLGEMELLTSLITDQKSMSLPTAFLSIETLDNKMEQLIQRYGESTAFGAALSSGRIKLKDYLSGFETNLHLIATILHPRAKVAYFDVIKPNLKERALSAINEIFNAYNTGPITPVIKKFKPNTFSNDILSQVFDRINSQKSPIQDELNAYLSSITENMDILAYWKKHQPDFPTLSKIARDIFAIQGISGASESAYFWTLGCRRLPRSDITTEEIRMLKESQGVLASRKTFSLS